MKLATLNDALIVKLQSLYDIEMQLTKALPKLVESATNTDLKEAFAEHLKETEAQVERLKKIFEIMKIQPAKDMEVAGIRGLIEDAEWIIEQDPEKPILDSMLITAASYVEHYEMAGYMSAARWANMLELSEVEDILSETLSEEEMAADKLAALAEEKIDSATMTGEEV